MRSSHPPRRAQALTMQISVMALLLAQAWPGYAVEPAQFPLLSRSMQEPPPNVMLTVDDSGSMTYQYLPERAFTLNGQQVDFPTDKRVYVHPKELDRNIFLFEDYTRFLTAADNSELNGKMLLTQAQMRSPQVNTIYYNPTKKYEPWRTADNVAYANATATKAWLHPSYLAPNAQQPVDLSLYVDLTTISTHDVRWFCRDNDDWSKCGPAVNQAKTSLNYSPGLVYILRANANPNTASSYTKVDINANSTVSWALPDETEAALMKANRPDCTRTGTTLNFTCPRTSEQQNFANWFVYARSRLFVAQGAMPEAIRNSRDAIRLGWGTIHPKQVVNSDGKETGWTTFNPDADITSSVIAPSASVQQGVRTLDQAHLAKFVDWIRDIGTQRYTPTLHAVYSVGEYFKRTGSLNPWQNDMSRQTDPSAALSCRRAYNVLITDGYYQNNATLDSWGNMFAAAGLTLPSVGNVDSTVTAPGGTVMEGVNAKPFPGSRDGGALMTRGAFADSVSDTLADYAMDLWAKDLQPGIPNKVQPVSIKTTEKATSLPELVKEVQGDPATWQHLTHFTVSLGVKGTLLTRDKKQDTVLSELITGPQSWPSPVNEIDDLWHAAVNSRGRYFEASDKDQLKQSLEDALGGTLQPPQNDSGLATASSILESGNFRYVPRYSAKDWSGDIWAYALEADGKSSSEVKWKASASVPLPSARNVVIWQRSSETTGLAVPFNTLEGLNTETRAYVKDVDLINFIRGDTSSGALRKRSNGSNLLELSGIDATGPQPGEQKVNVLPDFINSMPLYVKSGIDRGYASIGNMAGRAAYASYLADKKSQRPNGLLFIGGNGGMLHAFNTASGAEVFALIPFAAVPKLPLIASQDYGKPGVSHQYVVDGQLSEADAYFAKGSEPPAWHNIVVGTMGAGGKSVFALRVPVDGRPPPTGTEAPPPPISAGDVLLEASHADMGYITSTPQVGLAPDGRWKIFVGNGFNSSTGATALLIIDLASGDVTSVTAGSASTTDTNHGMGGVALVRDASSAMVTAVYGGDSRGRLWRFDLSSSGGATVGFGGNPLFTARDADNRAQPITAEPVVVAHPRGGQVVVLNTGRLLYETDADDTSVQSAYGIWDKVTAGTSSSASTSPDLTRASLAEQTIDSLIQVTQANGKTGNFFNISRNSLDWAAKSGWLLDLAPPTSTGSNASRAHPKALYAPHLFGQSVLITAIEIGATAPACEISKSKGYGFVLKALTGASPPYASVDVNQDGIFSSDESIASGFETEGGPLRLLDYPSSSTDSGCQKKNSQEADSSEGRGVRDCPDKSIKDRVWRQLLNPPAP